ncbi:MULTISPECIES: hypothetical protein [unclassified Nodularia (in: cyanobacteria)]|uniref:hypothetical protein n=1 Tax=unclassified Nodularia (in: cyanobacteria) TaxID=2656917 RepID=UPI00187DFC8F|nr:MULTISPECIES: hypothetical protein [unclassified Nodularia (in: cyanobacteria)]MBE9200754.1 hypothetical protein [Nodularia sp. LEGE 06071]MCC2692073.1 hypothetical protein [Nodularia sp. LEGE 04288]
MGFEWSVYLRQLVLGTEFLATLYTQVIEFSQAFTEPPPNPELSGTRIFKVPQSWGI